MCDGARSLIIASRVNEGAGSWGYDTIEERVFLSDNPGDAQLPLSDLCLATAAAPVYFPAAYINGVKYLDGGLLANNPSARALEHFGQPHLLTSLGTGQYRAQQLESFFGNPVLQRITNVGDVTIEGIDAQVAQVHAEMQRVVEALYLRLDPSLTEEIKVDAADRLRDMKTLMDEYLFKDGDGSYREPAFQSLLDGMKRIVCRDTSVYYNTEDAIREKLDAGRMERDSMVVDFDGKWIECGRAQTLTEVLRQHSGPMLSLRLTRCGLSNEAANLIWDGIRGGGLRVKEVDLSGNDIDLRSQIKALRTLLLGQIPEGSGSSPEYAAPSKVDSGREFALTRITLNNTDSKMNIDAPSDEDWERHEENPEHVLPTMTHKIFDLVSAIKHVFFNKDKDHPTLIERLDLDHAHLFEQFGWFHTGANLFDDFINRVQALGLGPHGAVHAPRLRVDHNFTERLLIIRRESSH